MSAHIHKHSPPPRTIRTISNNNQNAESNSGDTTNTKPKCTKKKHTEAGISWIKQVNVCQAFPCAGNKPQASERAEPRPSSQRNSQKGSVTVQRSERFRRKNRR